MKKILVAMLTVTVLLIGGLTANADIGVPEGTRITVTIKPQGADYYHNVDSDNPEKAGRLVGGTPFYYLTGSAKNGYQYGTTDVNAADGETDKFVYVLSSDIESAKVEVTADIGTKTAATEAVTTDELNLRYGPGVGYEVKEVLPKDTKVHYEYTFDTDTTWMLINYNGMDGWVSGDYLKTVSVSTTKSAEPKTQAPADDVNAGNNAGNEKTDAGTTGFGMGILPLILFCVAASAVIASLVTYMLLRNKSKDKESRTMKDNEE